VNVWLIADYRVDSSQVCSLVYLVPIHIHSSDLSELSHMVLPQTIPL